VSLAGEIAYAESADRQHLLRKPYDQANCLREFALGLSLIQQRGGRGALLDLGCGPGWSSILFARAGFEVTAVDVAPAMIDVLKENATAQGVCLESAVADVTSLELARSDYAVAVFFDSLHHVPGYDAALARAHEHLRPGGLLLVMEPSWLHNYSEHARRTARDLDVTELGFSRSMLNRALKTAGFVDVMHHHDPGDSYRGLLGFGRMLLAGAADFCFAYPRRRRIVTAMKPGPAAAG